MTVGLVAGARPNFMKIAPLVRSFRSRGLATHIIHTGQHYDARMSQTFFDELAIPRPEINLGVGSGSAVWQIAEVMGRLEPVLTERRPSALVVVGDVNSTLAAALTATKLEIPVAHVEAGLRSFDRTMPEESNRMLTDSLARWLFTSEPSAGANLKREGIPDDRIHFVGNVMIDTLMAHRDRAASLCAHKTYHLPERNYVLLTLHRPSNVESPERLKSILRAVHEVSRRLPVVFPIHPRTRKRMEQWKTSADPNLNGSLGIAPVGYLEMLSLMDAARLVMTDSGGIQEETTALEVPCLTLRENTERPVTVDAGSNRLVGWRTGDIVEAVEHVLDGPVRTGQVPEKWDGRAAERIGAILERDVRRHEIGGTEHVPYDSEQPAAHNRIPEAP